MELKEGGMGTSVWVLAVMLGMMGRGVWGHVAGPGVTATVTSGEEATVITPGLSRTGGVDAGSGLAWTRVYLEGKVVAAGTRGGTEAAPLPTAPLLTAQCTRTGAGKMKFEVFANFGGVEDRGFYPPWKSSPGDLFPPRYDKVRVTMEFLGYTKVKPVKREWEVLTTPYGEMRYNTPSGASSNMEDITFYLRYLLALPTLRLTAPGRGTVEFGTAGWLGQVRKEEMCRASGL